MYPMAFIGSTVPGIKQPFSEVVAWRASEHHASHHDAFGIRDTYSATFHHSYPQNPLSVVKGNAIRSTKLQITQRDIFIG